jgi:CelD/BcsL family acetyltransferase involved in cellulose biosynthesis
MLRLNALRLDERIVATLYVLCAKRRACLYLIGVDPELETISPGTLIFGYSIQQALREGAREIDFLRGRERYKYFWGARDRPCYGRMLSRVR